MRKKSLCFICLIFIFSFFYVSAQQSDTIMTVEEAYLHSVEGVIIKELALSEGRDSKTVALQYIENAIESGRKTEEVQVALHTLVSEGITSVIKENGRIINNYPDIRLKACELLGEMGTSEAKDSLIAVMYADNEPSVIAAAVKSLGKLGFNEDDEVVEMVNWVARKFDIINPTSSLALEILNAYEKLAPSVKNKNIMIETIIRIAGNYNYVTPVRNRAFEVLKSVSNSNNETTKDSTQ